MPAAWPGLAARGRDAHYWRVALFGGLMLFAATCGALRAAAAERGAPPNESGGAGVPLLARVGGPTADAVVHDDRVLPRLDPAAEEEAAIADATDAPASAWAPATSAHGSALTRAPSAPISAAARAPSPPASVPAPAPGAPATAPARVASRSLRVELTAYAASAEDGTAAGITYSGEPVRPGVVAVDPAVIPLGSRLRIDGLPGVYYAADTGSGIWGAHVDVFMASRADALQFGRRGGVTVEVLD